MLPLIKKVYGIYNMKKFDLLIIGGGASGLIAALQAKTLAAGLQIAVLEKADRPGKKLLATGGGRCNIANRNAAEPGHYYTAKGDAPAFVRPAFNRYLIADDLAFFRSLGLLTKEEENGKMYPLGDQAAAVLDALRLHLAAYQIPLFTQTEVQKISPGFTLDTNGGRFAAPAVILAMGGMGSPKLSTCGDIGALTEPLGHKTTALYPALTQLKIADELPKAVQGVKIIGRAAVFRGDKMMAAEEGEILFTAYGLSGPPILQLSRLAAMPGAHDLTIRLDLLPEFPEAQLQDELLRRRKLPLRLEDFLTGMLNKRLGQQLIKRAAGLRLNEPAAAMSRDNIAAIAELIKNLSLNISGTTGWANAQAMAGGLSLKGFEPQTLASKLLPGLFACGEVLDICGDCGGYNLSWAWSSGRLAAASAVKYLTDRQGAKC